MTSRKRKKDERTGEPLAPMVEPLREPKENEGRFYGGTKLTWVNGHPQLEYTKPITVDEAKLVQAYALQAPYKGSPQLDYKGNPILDDLTGEPILVIEPGYEGLTNYMAMKLKQAERAAQGEVQLIPAIEDRALGKPKQSVESVSMSLTYDQFLEKMAADEGLEDEDDITVEADFYEETADELGEL